MKIQDVYTLENYLKKKSFASFLPGIAGVDGVPIWSFFVNRGQGISSFGIENKNKSIMEFYPANKSFETVRTHGFRTFIKIDGGEVYEAFSSSNKDVSQTMSIEKNILTIKEHNPHIGMSIQVEYFILPHEFFGSLVRAVSIENHGEARKFEIIDGMPEIIPSGMNTDIVKNMSFTARAWTDVYHREDGTPLYRVRSSIGDTESVEDINDGVFFVNAYKGQINTNLIIDRDLIFDYADDLIYPVSFQFLSLQSLLDKDQYTENKYSAGFACFDEKIQKGNALSFQSYYGYISSPKEFEKLIVYMKKKVITSEYYEQKREEARELISDLVNDIHTETAYHLFDQYCKQSYLDNILRGGYPLIIPQKDSSQLVYHVFARKHGDLERDYNFFHLEAKYYSQGNGSFRDICQNRRNDVLFNPSIGSFNVITFLNLIQADGYNPYMVKGLTLSIDKEETFSKIEEELGISLCKCVKNTLKNFTLGSLLEQAGKKNWIDTLGIEKIINTFVWYADAMPNADFGEGFWVDHFSYYIDLIESYLDIYPDKAKELMFDTKISYYLSPAQVRPRKEKYLYHEKTHKIVQKLAVEEIEEEASNIATRGHSYLVDESHNIYFASAYEKLLCLVSNRLSSLDINSIGIEMEANKPGWNDALNGLPGIIGSGVSELFEVLRIVDFLLRQTEELEDKAIALNEVVYNFALDLSAIFHKGLASIIRWDKTHSLREEYRTKVFPYIPRNKVSVSKNTLHTILASFKAQIERGYSTFFANGISPPPSFIENIISKYHMQDEKITVEEFTQRPLPLFLEAPAKSFYVLSKDEARELYRKIKESDIYDKKLNMYKTSESLESETKDIGRAKAFTPGWLERESIFMHMQFKYLLKLLEKGLYEEFYQDLFTCMPCFMDEETYGRPCTEASSFIVSSINNNPALHGRGFSARLSGSTAELISMWKRMFLGDTLFEIHDHELEFQLSPRLHKSFFPQNGIIKTVLFSKISVEIHNPSKTDTFSIFPRKIVCDGEEFEGNKIRGTLAEKIRNKEVNTIKVYY